MPAKGRTRRGCHTHVTVFRHHPISHSLAFLGYAPGRDPRPCPSPALALPPVVPLVYASFTFPPHVTGGVSCKDTLMQLWDMLAANPGSCCSHSTSHVANPCQETTSLKQANSSRPRSDPGIHNLILPFKMSLMGPMGHYTLATPTPSTIT